MGILRSFLTARKENTAVSCRKLYNLPSTGDTCIYQEWHWHKKMPRWFPYDSSVLFCWANSYISLLFHITIYRIHFSWCRVKTVLDHIPWSKPPLGQRRRGSTWIQWIFNYQMSNPHTSHFSTTTLLTCYVESETDITLSTLSFSCGCYNEKARTNLNSVKTTLHFAQS